MISGIGASYRAVEGLYSDGLVMMALRNLHVPLLKKKGITQSDVTNGTDYSLTVKNLMRRNLRIKPRRTEMKAMIRASNQRKREGHLLILLGRWALKKMYMSFGSGVKSGKEAFDGAMSFLKTVDVMLKGVR
jgi:transposase